MLIRKTQKRLNAAIRSVADLQAYLERASRKLDEEAETEGDSTGLQLWLNQQLTLYRRRRDNEPRSSETYRFFDGKSQGIEAVIRFLDERQRGKSRSAESKGYLSARGVNNVTSNRQAISTETIQDM